MSVRQRGETFQVDFTHGTSRIRKGGFSTRAKAEDWEQQALDRINRGQSAQSATNGGQPGTMKELLDRTYVQYWAGAKAEDVLYANGKEVVSMVGESTNPKNVDTNDVDYLIGKWKEKKLSGGTINRKLAALSKMLKFAHSRGWIDRMPHLERQRESEHRIRYLSEGEEEMVLTWAAWFGWDGFQDLIILLLDTGMRITEALNLTWADVSNDKGEIASGGWVRVNTLKRGEQRSIPMTDRVKGAITRRFMIHTDKHPGMFAFNRHQADKMWVRIREKMGLEKDEQFVIHALRHTFISRLAQAGTPLLTIQKLAGHKDISMTMRYAHLAPDNLVEAMAVINRGQMPQVPHAPMRIAAG